MSFLHLSGVVDGALLFVANWLIQSTLLIVVGLAVAATLGRRGAAVQSAVYRITLAAVLVAPVATWIWSGAGVAGWSLQPTVAVATASSPVQEINPAAPLRVGERQTVPTGETLAMAEREAATGAPMARDARGQPTITTEAANDMAAGGGVPIGLVICLAWAAGSGWLLFRLLRSARGLSRLRGSAVPADPGAVALLQQLSAERGMRAPELLRTPLIDSACLAGVRRPAIFLPEETMALPLRDVLVHELGHLRRGDCLWHWISQLAVAGFFFQPLLWLLARRMEAAAEEVCDNCVLEAGIDSREYAARLVELVEQSHEPLRIGGIGIVPVRSLLPRRIRRLLNPKGVRATAVGCRARMAVICGGVAAAMLAGLVGAAGPAQEAPATDHVLRGVVQTVDGNRIAGAPVHLVAHFSLWGSSPWGKNERLETVARVRTNSAGEFALRVPLPEETRATYYQIVSSPDGYGIATGQPLADLIEAKAEAHGITVSAAIPIEGRVVSRSGEPVAGARVLLTEIANRSPPGTRRSIRIMMMGLYRLEPLFEFWPPEVVTDADGFFRLSAIDAESVANFLVEADGYASANLSVASDRYAAEINERREQSGLRGQQTMPASGFVHALDLPKVFEGIVTDAGSGEPIEGVGVKIHSNNRGPYLWAHGTTTDASGRYRIAANPVRGQYTIWTTAEDHIGYKDWDLSAEKVDEATAGGEPIRYDIALTPGVRVHGRVVDDATGEGLTDVKITYYPSPENPSGEQFHSFEHQVVLTDSEGRYRIPGLPGAGFLLAEINAGEYLRTPLFIDGEVAGVPHGLLEIEIPREETWSAPPIVLREGVEIGVRAVGPRGERVERLHVATLETSGGIWPDLMANQIPYRGGQHRMAGLRPDRTYRTFVYSSDLNAGAILDLRYDPEQTKPREVRLEPAAAVRGRLVWEDGTPASNLGVWGEFVMGDGHPEPSASSGFQISKVAPTEPITVVTGENGEFEVANFFGGTEALLSITRKFADGTQTHRIGKLDAGEGRDVGTLELQRPE